MEINTDKNKKMVGKRRGISMGIWPYLAEYLRWCPLQLALIRAAEAEVTSNYLSQMKSPILEIGCSDGIFGQVLFGGKKGVIDVGVDVDKSALILGKSMSVYKRMKHADARKLPFGKNTFQTVFSNQSLEHIDGIDQVLSEISRVLAPGGTFIFLVPTIFLDDYWLTSAPFKWIGLRGISEFFHDKRNKLFKHFNLLPVETWKEKLSHQGFRLHSYQYVGTKPRYFISELFQPARLPQYLLWNFFGIRALTPRRIVLPVAAFLEREIEQREYNRPLAQGPTMLLVAGKK